VAAPLTPGERLPPFPDELLDPARVEAVVTFIQQQDMPSRYRRAWLGRWAQYVGLELDRSFYDRVGFGRPYHGG
jgi:hypothetical protein